MDRRADVANEFPRARARPQLKVAEPGRRVGVIDQPVAVPSLTTCATIDASGRKARPSRKPPNRRRCPRPARCANREQGALSASARAAFPRSRPSGICAASPRRRASSERADPRRDQHPASVSWPCGEQHLGVVLVRPGAVRSRQLAALTAAEGPLGARQPRARLHAFVILAGRRRATRRPMSPNAARVIIAIA